MRAAPLFVLIAASFVAATPASAQAWRLRNQETAPAATAPSPAAPAVRVQRPDALVTVRQPRFSVTAHRIIANDETGPDWPGSDEIYAVYVDRSGSGLTVYTSRFGDVDTGEIRNFGSAHQCITHIVETAEGPEGYPISWRCEAAGAAAPLRFSVRLYESDGWSPMACAGSPNSPPTPANCDDDYIGGFTQGFSEAELIQHLPRVGDTFTRERRVGGYTFAYVVRRAADHVTQVQRTPAATAR